MTLFLPPSVHCGSSCHRLKDLCTTAFHIVRSKSQNIEDFTKTAVEASQWGLINDQQFRGWFIEYVNKRHDQLLEILSGDNHAMKLCKILVSALALTKDDHYQRDPSTPSNLPPTPPISVSQKRHRGLELNSRNRVAGQSPLKRKETLGSSAKKRKLNASVEDASASD
jgi:hypothetical protein